MAALARRASTRPAAAGRSTTTSSTACSRSSINAGNGPTIRDGVDASTRPSSPPSPTWPRRTRTRPRPHRPTRTDEETAVTTIPPTTPAALELDDIQSGALHERPSPYVGAYLLLRIDDRGGRAGSGPAARTRSSRPAARRTSPRTAPGSRSPSPTTGCRRSACRRRRWTASHRSSGRAWRPAPSELGDVGESDPAHWEKPARHAGRPRRARRSWRRTRRASSAVRERARRAHEDLAGVEVIWRQDCYQLPTGRTSFGFKDGIGQPAVEGSGRPPRELARARRSRPASSSSATRTRPASCRRCRRRTCSAATAPTSSSASCTPASRRTGSTCARRPTSREDEALLGAKMVGRWQSGAPLALAPERDDPELGADPERNNDFVYGDDLRGFKCPAGAHARRANPRDALDHEVSVNTRLHRMIRRGTSYGPMLPDGVHRGRRRRPRHRVRLRRRPPQAAVRVRQDPVAERRHLHRRAGGERPAGRGRTTATAAFTVPHRPIRRRLTGMPPFVVTRGGEYCFAPGLRALRWLADLDT